MGKGDVMLSDRSLPTLESLLEITLGALGILLFSMWSLLLFPAPAKAHGTGYRIAGDKQVTTIEAFYSSNEPMAYAEVLIFSPEDKDVEYQNGRTDKNGRFAFYPDIGGTWRVTVSDGMGHKIDAEVQVNKSAGDEVKSEAATHQVKGLPDTRSKILSIILGLSLIMNLFLALYLKRRGPRAASIGGGAKK